MKVFANDVAANPAIQRIVTAFKRYSPDTMEFVDTQDDADFVIIHAYGHRRQVKYRAERLQKAGKKYAIVQLTIRSTSNPDTADWIFTWRNAELIWSYLDLPKLCREDGVDPNFVFYFAPLGVDTDLFEEIPIPSRGYKIVVGNSRDESVAQCVNAAEGKVFHLGQGVSEQDLVYAYSSSEYVSGLRHIEGFEMPVLEGLMCGARPISFDKPHYRHWFDEIAEFIPEGNGPEVEAFLRELFSKPVRTVTQTEKERVAYRFNWQPIIEGFWAKI